MVALLDFGSEQFEQFFIYKSQQYFLLSFESIGLLVQKKMLKLIFKMLAMAAILDSASEQCSLFFTYKLPWYFLPSFKSIHL